LRKSYVTLVFCNLRSFPLVIELYSRLTESVTPVRISQTATGLVKIRTTEIKPDRNVNVNPNPSPNLLTLLNPNF